jgi:hypothetical protein
VAFAAKVMAKNPSDGPKLTERGVKAASVMDALDVKRS